MSRIINGATCLSVSEMAKTFGGTPQQWGHFARTGKVPATKWINGNWYFNPDEINALAVSNGYGHKGNENG